MNTREINGSSWPITYLLATALPLTFVTILVPLYALRITNVIARLFQGDTRVRRYFKWGLYTLGISLALTCAISETVRPGTGAGAIWIASSTIADLMNNRYLARY
ncbi:hypothetical protein BJX62DRAFT_239328 [Aspergillus germanicus]